METLLLLLVYGLGGFCALLCVCAIAWMFYEDFLSDNPPLL